MMTKNVEALIGYRLEQAEESLEASRILIEKDLHRQSLNRSYYAMFYAVLALLATQRKETSKHSGAISLFDTEFVKRGIFEKDLSRWLHNAFDLRQRSDYGPELHVSKEEAQKAAEHAQYFVKAIKEFLEKG